MVVDGVITPAPPNTQRHARRFTGQADDLTAASTPVRSYLKGARQKRRWTLPDSVQVTRGAYEFASPVEVIAIDIGSDLGTAQALFDRFNVPV